MNGIQYLVTVQVIVVLFSFVHKSNSQQVYQDSLLKVLGVDEVIYTKDVYYDKDYRYTAPVVFGFDSLNIQGKPFTSVRYFGKHATIFHYYYNDKGQIIEKIWYRDRPDNMTRAIEYEYDRKDRLKYEYSFAKDESHKSTVTYFYDGANKVERISRNYIVSDIQAKEKYHYEKGEISDIVYSINEMEDYTLRHKYDESGKLIEKYRDLKENKYGVINFEYDSLDRLTKKKYSGRLKFINSLEYVHNMKVDSQDFVEFVYEYQDNGLVKSKTQYKNGAAYAKLNFAYIYYD